MGAVIRMNIAAGLGRAELSPAVVRNRCQLTHICTACWEVGVTLITSGTLYIWGPKDHRLPPPPWFTVSPGSVISAAVSLSLAVCHAHIDKHNIFWSTKTNVSGIKNNFQALIWRSNVLAGPLLDCDPDCLSLKICEYKHSLLHRCVCETSKAHKHL